MIVRARYVSNGVEVEVIDHPDFLGWRASGGTIREAVANLTEAVGVEGFLGQIVLWRRVP